MARLRSTVHRPVAAPPADRPVHRRAVFIAVVFLGGMGGTLCRYWLNGAIPAPQELPLPTLLINLGGSFFLGVLLEALLRGGPDAGMIRLTRLLAGTGFLGGFTTYSAFAVEAVGLGAGGKIGLAAAYIALSVVGGILLSFAGIGVSAAIARWKRRRARAGAARR